MPGTSTRENPQNPGVAVNIRGFEGSGRVNMMIDGVRQNFRFTAHEAKGFAYVDPALLAGVDIMRGARSRRRAVRAPWLALPICARWASTTSSSPATRPAS